ncbi:DUF1801 domain-containing protein [Lewinella sp. W8]|uniref:DUF1801 domain-containing protein n=1 Tax=Lewinella sp. W8 TaxID=2528208 RepID=UPI001067FBE2|nr:DUF1801 domain-containing protein [Lewinella sp. W8]MTB52704.1 DUF1801 domain-containing protein [Lewinella sp. W8]
MLTVHQHPDVAAKFAAYPEEARQKLLALRKLIVEVADELKHIVEMEECLKWGEPSYLVKKGSTLRIDWKPKYPDRYAMYFKCTSQLVPTFREIYGDTFTYEGNRALHFRLDEAPPEAPLRECIAMALSYHRIKHLPKLGK